MEGIKDKQLHLLTDHADVPVDTTKKQMNVLPVSYLA